MSIRQQNFIQDLLNKPGRASKKFIMACWGLGGIGFFYVTSFIFMLYKPEVAGQIQSVAITAIGTFGTLAGICVGVQGWQDANATSALTNGTTHENT